MCRAIHLPTEEERLHPILEPSDQEHEHVEADVEAAVLGREGLVLLGNHGRTVTPSRSSRRGSAPSAGRRHPPTVRGGPLGGGGSPHRARTAFPSPAARWPGRGGAPAGRAK